MPKSRIGLILFVLFIRLLNRFCGRRAFAGFQVFYYRLHDVGGDGEGLDPAGSGDVYADGFAVERDRGPPMRLEARTVSC